MNYTKLYEAMAVIMRDPPQIGTKIAVTNWEHIPVTVINVQYINKESRYKITLDWGQYGISYVYNHDEGTVWHRKFNIN